eukprot:scaffold224224_cov28-Tisochrysis_lutea.AAC.6
MAQPRPCRRVGEAGKLPSESGMVVVDVRTLSLPGSEKETRGPTPRCKRTAGESPSSVIRGRAADISNAAVTARASSSSWARPGKPKAIKKRVPLSSVMTRKSVPPWRSTFSCTTATAAWQSIKLSTSQLRLPRPRTFKKTETSLRCSETYKPSSCPA